MSYLKQQRRTMFPINLALILCFSWPCFCQNTFYEFIPNTNLLQSNMLKSSSCYKKRMVIENEDPIALMVNSNWEFGEVVFPADSSVDIIFGEKGVAFTNEDVSYDAKSCKADSDFVFKTDWDVPFWHDSSVWKYMNDSAVPPKPFLHAEMIPGQYDVAYFNPANSHRVYIDTPVKAGGLISGGFSHTTETFLSHIETQEGVTQFHLPDDVDPDDPVDDIIMETFPQVRIYGKDCEDQTGCVSYHLNSKVLPEICKRVTCPTSLQCSKSFTPTGHCCDICGGMIKFFISTDYNHNNARNIFNATWTKNGVDGRYSFMKIADWEYQLVVIKGNGEEADYDAGWIREKTDMMKKIVVEKLDGVSDATVTVYYSTDKYNKVALGFSLFFIICLLIGAAFLSYRRRAQIANWYIGRRIQMRAFWRDDQSDRIHLEMADPTSRDSLARESMSSFENPTFKHLLAQEEDKATMASVYEQKMPSLAYNDKSSITFSNPLFEGGAGREE